VFMGSGLIATRCPGMTRKTVISEMPICFSGQTLRMSEAVEGTKKNPHLEVLVLQASKDATPPSSALRLTEWGAKTSVRARCQKQCGDPPAVGGRLAREFRAPARFASET